jgi:integrase
MALSGSLGKCRRKQVGQLPLFGSAAPAPVVTWDQAATRWLTEQAHKSAIESDRFHIRWMDQHLSGRRLDTINKAVISEIVQAKLSEGVSNSTVNRLLSVLRAILRRAVDRWDWLDSAPKVFLLPQSTLRIRFLTRDEAQRLLNELPCHLAAMAAFSLVTGLRASNVTGLQWSQVDLDRRLAWIHANEAKGRKAIPVPLNADAISVLRQQCGQSDVYVFTYHGKRIIQVSTKAWYAALGRAGIENFRWHDLRHTWASWHAQDGTPLFALQELGGWQSSEMVRRYAHLSVHHLSRYADNFHLSPGV